MSDLRPNAESVPTHNCVREGGEHCLHWPLDGVYCCRCDHDTRLTPPADGGKS